MAMTNRSETLYLCSKFMKVICTILPSMILARLYSKGDYGVFLECQLIVQLLSMVASFGLPKSIYYFCGRREDRGRVIANALLMLICFGGISCLLLYGFQYTVGLKESTVAGLLPLISFQIISRTPNQALQAIFISMDKVNAGTTVQFLEAVITCGVLMGLGALTYPITVLMWVLVAIDVLLLVVTVIYLKIPVLQIPAIDWRLWKEQMVYCFPIALAITAFMFGRRFDQMLIASLFTIDDFAVYSRGAVEIPLNNVVTFSLAGLATPVMLMHHKNHDLASMVTTWNTTVEKASRIMIPCFWFLILMRQDFIECLYSKRYISSVPVFCVYLLLIPLQVCTFDIVFQVINRTRVIFIASVINVTLNIACSYLFVSNFGMVGAAYGTIASLACTNIFYLVMMWRCLGLPVQRLFPWKRFIWFNMFAMLASVSIFLPVQLLASPFERLLVAAPSFTLAYAAATGDLRAFRNAIFNLWPLKRSANHQV